MKYPFVPQEVKCAMWGRAALDTGLSWSQLPQKLFRTCPDAAAALI